jgi:hypothetical protein
MESGIAVVALARTMSNHNKVLAELQECSHKIPDKV